MRRLAMQMDRRRRIARARFAVQDALLWVSYILSITVAAALDSCTGIVPVFVLFGSASPGCGAHHVGATCDA